MAAFALSVHVNSRRCRRGGCSSAHASHRRVGAVPVASARAQLKHRSVIALRALSDLAGMAFVNELWHRFSATAPADALMADAQLLFGGLIGIWTAAAFAERFRVYTTSYIDRASQLPTAWDSSLITFPEMESSEVPAVLAWLFAFDAIESPDAVQLIRSLAMSNIVATRIRLAHALSLTPVRSNVTLAIVALLASDNDVDVRAAASLALSSYISAGITTSHDMSTMLPSSATPTVHQLFSSSNSNLSPHQLSSIINILNRVLTDPAPVPVMPVHSWPLLNHHTAWKNLDRLGGEMARYVGCMRHVALSCPDLSNSPACMLLSEGNTAHYESAGMDVRRVRTVTTKWEGSDEFENGYGEQTVSSSEDANSDYQCTTPLIDSLYAEEVHGICALAVIPAFYELFSTVQHESLPLRFLGLGWLFTVGGLAAYPNSANLWNSLSRTIEDMSHVKFNREGAE